jgi:DNA-binding NtrC family response regulator
VTILNYPQPVKDEHGSEVERRVEQLVMLSRALANEIATLQAEITTHQGDGVVENESIDFYDAVEHYEIELLTSALNKCHGNQTQAARLLRMKSTTLNAKMKHYGLNPVRSITLRRAQSK